ncbi:MAG: DUF501 domain-containing protein [Actinomycetes bacterium]
MSPRPATVRVPDPVPATPADVDAVLERLGRSPQADFEVVVRTSEGAPVVLRNAPLLRDGTPMPTRYWLVDPELNRLVGAVEAEGGVRAADAAIPPEAIAATHAAYAAERDAALPPGHSGPRPSGGVGGTRRGVKCLHAHYANLLAGADDPVGAWTEVAIAALDPHPSEEHP